MLNNSLWFKAGALALMVATFTACSSSTHGNAFLPPSPQSVPSIGWGDLVLRVTTVKASMRGLTPDYISPATKGLTVKIAGPTSIEKTVGLTLSATGCKSSLMTTQCTLTVPLKACPSTKNCYVATVATYDAYKNGKIPKGAHQLSADQNFAFTITTGKTLIPLTLEGLPHAVAFFPSAESSLMGSQTAGFIEPKCHARNETVSVVAVDADGNYIVGAGAPRVSLQSSDKAQLAVSKSRSSPNDFVLSPPKAPAYPYGNHAIVLTATVTPGANSGGVRRRSRVKVAYSGDICGVLTEFPVPTAASILRSITAGPDGALWFTELGANKIGRSTTMGQITEYPVPTAGSFPFDIASGPDGNVWFGETGGSKIGRISPKGAITEFSTLTASSQPNGITAGPDGNLWFAEGNANKIARITTAGAMTEFPVPTASSDPDGITVGPDGNLWFTEFAADKIGFATTGGSVTEFPGTGGSPAAIVAGPDRALWLVAALGNVVQRATTAGSITSTYTPITSGSRPFNIVSGPDGALWFTEFSGNVGRVTVSGNVTEYLVASKSVWGITVGPDGAIWFADVGANMIGRLR